MWHVGYYSQTKKLQNGENGSMPNVAIHAVFDTILGLDLRKIVLARNVVHNLFDSNANLTDPYLSCT